MTTARLHTDGSPILFAATEENREIVGYITSEKFFGENECLDDSIRCPDDCEGWGDLAEATMQCFCCETVLEAKENLISQGFVYSEALQKFMDETIETRPLNQDIEPGDIVGFTGQSYVVCMVLKLNATQQGMKVLILSDDDKDLYCRYSTGSIKNLGFNDYSNNSVELLWRPEK